MNSNPITVKVVNEDLAWTRKSTANWKRYQLKIIGAKDINADYNVTQFIKRNRSYTYNLTWANPSVKLYAQENNINVNNDNFDFYIICDLEFGKLPILELEETIKRYYSTSRKGGYFSFQSYYLNWTNDSRGCREDLTGNMDIALPLWIEKYLGIAKYTNNSLSLSSPLTNRTSTGELIAGSDFMYTHGNVRIWTWK